MAYCSRAAALRPARREEEEPRGRRKLNERSPVVKRGKHSLWPGETGRKKGARVDRAPFQLEPH